MTISIQSSVFHQSKSNLKVVKDAPAQEKDLRRMLEEEIQRKGEQGQAEWQWLDDETLEINNLSGLALHSFLLKVEELGKNITYKKKTVIEIG
jgi:hypothetical protein